MTKFRALVQHILPRKHTFNTFPSQVAHVRTTEFCTSRHTCVDRDASLYKHRNYTKSCASANASASNVSWHGTTILCVRKGGEVVVIGDGQVSMGNTVVKPNARKVRRIGGAEHPHILAYMPSRVWIFKALLCERDRGVGAERAPVMPHHPSALSAKMIEDREDVSP